MTISKAKSKWRDRKVERIVESGEITKGLEELARDYWPGNIRIRTGREYFRPYVSPREYVINEFIDAYAYHRESDHPPYVAIDKAVFAVTTQVLLCREDAYEG